MQILPMQAMAESEVIGAAYKYIDVNRARFVEGLKEFLRIPSAATDAKAGYACARKLERSLTNVGFDARLTYFECLVRKS